MMRLIWKEMRERGWVLLLWALAIIGVTVFQPDMSFFGGWQRMSSTSEFFNYILTALGLFAGSCAYSSELAKDRASFVFMRPIAWWKMWLSKFIPGVVVLVVAPLISLSLYYIFGPASYHPFITATNVFAGLGYAIWQGAILYLLGLLCAPVIPSYAGGIVTIAAVGTIWAVQLVLVEYFLWKYEAFSNIEAAVTILICIAVLVGGILIARYAVRLDFQERAIRYLRVIAWCMVIGVIVGVISLLTGMGDYIQKSLQTKDITNDWRISRYDISPGGSYAFIEYARQNEIIDKKLPPETQRTYERQIIDLNTGSIIKKAQFYRSSITGFVADDLLMSTGDSETGPSGDVGNIYQVPTKKNTIIPRTWPQTINFAADEKHFFIRESEMLPEVLENKSRKSRTMLTCYSFPEVNEIIKFDVTGFRYLSWLDNNTIVYLDKDKKRQTIRVGE